MTARPAPRPTAETLPFWEGCNAGVLRYQRCLGCGSIQFYPRDLCARCQGRDLEWRDSAGHGQVHSYTVVHRAPTPAFREHAPYVLALVDLDEGFRIMVNLLHCPPERAAIGLRVTIVFERRGDQAIPQARPVE